MKPHRWKLLTVTIIGLVLRCIFLESRNIQYDDAFSILLSSRNLSEIIKGTAADTMPPFYYFLLHFWMQISGALWWLRLLSVILSIGTLFVLFVWIKDIAGENAGLAAAALAAISPLQIYHAQDLRMYALLALCQLGFMMFFTRLWLNKAPERKNIYWAGLILCGTAAMYSHNLAIFVLAVPNLFLLWKRQFRLFWQLVLAQLVIGVLCIPWLWLIPGQVAKIQQAFWTPRPGIVEVFQSIILFHASLPLPGVWLAVASVVSLQIFVVVGIEVWKSKKLVNYGLILVGALIPPVLLFLVSYIMRPVFVTRGFLFSALAYSGLAGVVISRSFPKGIGGGLAFLFVLCAAIALPYQQTFKEFPRSPFRAACAALKTEWAPGNLLLHDNKLSYFPCAYYEPELAQKFIMDEHGSHNDTLAAATQDAMRIYPEPDAQTAVNGYRRVSYMVFSKTLEELGDSEQKKPDALEWLLTHFQLDGINTFGDLKIYEFKR